MELPIRVMIVLFVALVVASVIILFARNTIDDARRQMLQISKEQPEKIVDKGTGLVSVAEIVYLAQSCYENKKGQTISEELCYLVHGNIQTAGLDAKLTEAKVPHQIDSFSDSSLFIYYNPYLGNPPSNKVRISK
jgi:hypothetical protein